MEKNRNYLKYGLHLAVAAGLVWAIVKYVNGQEVWESLRRFELPYLLVMVGLALAYYLIKGVHFLLLISPFNEKIPKSTILKGYLAGQAVALLPGGVAARAGLMKQLGIPIAQSSVTVAFHSGWDQVIFLLGGIIAALWFPAARLPVLIILAVLAVLAVLLIISTTRHWLAGLAARLAKRFGYKEQWAHFLQAIPLVFTWRIMLGCFAVTVVSMALQITLLGMALHGAGLAVSLPVLFLAFIVPTMLGRIIPVPGGFGVTEAGMVGFLTSTANLSTDSTVAAVAIFRVLSIVLPAMVGAIIYYFFWNGEGETSKSAVRGQREPA
ncbi:MAG: flippase-like domain-containing protein [Anaerolineales bacterium]|nr:flippase-like domain-containing protein [Anaerolineales bacterium]